MARKTISENPGLFKIVTPINVDRFQELLVNHPNPLFVASVCAGLRNGFWPWANTLKDGYPSIYDGSKPTPHDEEKAKFIRAQKDVEVAKGRFSHPFGPDLLPGMYCMPAHAVPKPNSTDLRMVTDHSAGPFSLNSMVDRSQVTGYPLDNMTHMGEMLIAHHRSTTNDRKSLIWKSDIAEAYRLMPLHPHWQLKQINTVDGMRYVDRNVPFGNSSSAAIFISFNSLVAWIAKYERGIRNLATYMDDSSGFDYEDDLLPYPPYQTSFPRHQTLLLELWDELSIPHKPKKQIFGSVIPIIGIDVDPNALTLTLSPADSQMTGIFYFEALCVFCALADIAGRTARGTKVVIFTDNLNTVQIFNSLACLPEYNHLLRRSVDIALANELDLRVLHVPGEQNIVADALSRCLFSVALDAAPQLKISPFQPPQWTLGAAKK